MARHAFSHVEWFVTDLVRARAFYGGLFDWRFEPWGDRHLMCWTPSGPSAVLSLRDRVEPGGSPAVFVEVESIDPYLRRSEQLGGKLVVGRSEVEGLGWWAQLADPDGNLVGLFEPLDESDGTVQ